MGHQQGGEAAGRTRVISLIVGSRIAIATGTMNAFRALALSLALLLAATGTVGVPVLGPTAASAQEVETPATDDDDDGFDDWGLLGLLGLLGLAGLLRRPARAVVVDEPAGYRSR